MFQFPGFASPDLCVQSGDDISSRCRVAPFGDLRISAYLQLPAAYRSLSRPSSPAHAKASTICPSLLNTFEFYTSQVFRGLSPSTLVCARTEANGLRLQLRVILLANISKSKNPDASVLVELAGFEPATLCMQNRCSASEL